MAFALVLLVAGVVPLAVVLFLVLPAQPPTDMAYFLWAAFSSAVGGVCALAFRAGLPVIALHAGGLNDVRARRLATIVLFTVSAALLPLWFAVLGPWPDWGVWARIAFVPASFLVTLAMVRFIGLPAYWDAARAAWGSNGGWYRDTAADTGADFIGSLPDQRMRPEYYDEDVRWLVQLLRKRLTSASS